MIAGVTGLPRTVIKLTKQNMKRKAVAVQLQTIQMGISFKIQRGGADLF